MSTPRQQSARNKTSTLRARIRIGRGPGPADDTAGEPGRDPCPARIGDPQVEGAAVQRRQRVRDVRPTPKCSIDLDSL